MSEIEKTIKEILPKITPTKKDRHTIKKVLDSLLTKIAHELTSMKINPSIEVVGSIAKDTYLRDSLDIDIFLLFDPKVKRNNIAQTTQTIGKKILSDTEECYAEHPYIRGMFRDFKIELVPGYKIQDATEKISAVDRTPLHTKYIQKHISDRQKQDIRLLKQFLHGINCYGAEAEIQGFSGYLCEILIINYQDFPSLLEQAKDWEPPIKLSLHDEPTNIFTDPVIFIDPVDSNRNVASAVFEKTLQRFINACNEFLKYPKTTFFFPNPIKPWSLSKIATQIKKQNNQFVGIIFPKPNLISENLIPQIRKTCRVIQKEAERNGFSIHDIDFTIDQSNNLIYIIIQTNQKPLSKSFTHPGPPVNLINHKKKFIEKWKDHPLIESTPHEKNNRLYVKVKRTHRTLIPFLMKTLPEYSLGRHIEHAIKNHYLILKDQELVKKELQEFWTKYFDGLEPWER